MKKSLGFVLLLIVAACVCCAVAFGFMYDNTKKQCAQLQEQIGLYQDNEKDLADALKSLRECNNRIKDLESKLNKALADGNVKDSTIEQLMQDLENANADKLTLQNEVTRLQGLLNSYSDLMNQTYSIQFYNGEENHATRAVSKLNPVLGEDDSIGTPTRRNCTFIGWGLNEKDNATINLATYEFTQDTILYAKFNEIKYGLFNEEGTVVYTWDELIENHWISNSNAGLDASLGWEQLIGQLCIADGVTRIEDFSGCAGLTCVKIPQSVVSVNETAFNMCSNLETIIIDSDAVVKQMLSDTDKEMNIWQARILKIRSDVYESNRHNFSAFEDFVMQECDDGYFKSYTTSTDFVFAEPVIQGQGTSNVKFIYQRLGNATNRPEDFCVCLKQIELWNNNGLDVMFDNYEWVDYAPSYTNRLPVIMHCSDLTFTTNAKGVELTISASFDGNKLIVEFAASEAINVSNYSYNTETILLVG